MPADKHKRGKNTANRRGRPKKHPAKSVAEWLQRYPGLFTAFAPFFVESAAELHEIIQSSAEEDFFAKKGVADWKALYANPPSWQSVLSYLHQAKSDTKLCMDSALNHPQNFGDAFVSDFTKEISPMLTDQLQKGIIPSLAFNFQPEKIIRPESETADGCHPLAEFVKHPATIFFVTVSLPCWMRHQETVESLIAKVSDEDVFALEKLLRFDARFMENDIVRERYIAVARSGNNAQKEMFAKILTGKPDRAIELKTVKYVIASLMVAFVEKANAKTEKDLADIVAAGRNSNTLEVHGFMAMVCNKIVDNFKALPGLWGD